MKKLLLFVATVVGGLLAAATPASSTLFQYYQEIGQPLPSCNVRAGIAAEYGMQSYDCRKAQDNKILETKLRSQIKDVAYWVDRIKNNDSYPLSNAELKQVPEEAWNEVTPQLINFVNPNLSGDLVGGAEPVVTHSLVCRGKVCEKYIQKSDIVGFSVVSRYKTTLASSMTSSQTTVPVATLTTFDNTTLTMALLGSKVFLTIEPGSVREEISKCTDITNSRFSSCTRGLAFSGTSEASVTANQKAHNAGSIVVMSNVHYVYDQLLDNESSETVSGTKRFADNELVLGDGITSTTKKLYFCDSIATTTCGYVYAAPSSTNPGAQTLGYSPDGTTTYTFDQGSSGLTASTTKGIGITDSKIHINASSTGGIEFDATTGYTQIKTNSSGGIKTDSTGVSIDPTDSITYTGNNTFSGRLNVSSTPSTPAVVDFIKFASSTASSTFAGPIEVNNVGPFSGNTTTWRGNLQINGSLDYTGNRYGSTLSNNGVTSTPANVTYSGVLAHGLGVIPSIVRFNVSAVLNSLSRSAGMYSTSSGNQNSVFSTLTTVRTGSSSSIVYIQDSDGNVYQITINSVDATNINFTIDNNSSAGSTRYILWEVSK